MTHPYAEYGIQPRSAPLRSSRGPVMIPEKPALFRRPAEAGFAPVPLRPRFCGRNRPAQGRLPPLQRTLTPAATPEVSSPAIPRSTAAAAGRLPLFLMHKAAVIVGSRLFTGADRPSPVSKISEISKTGPCRLPGIARPKRLPLCLDQGPDEKPQYFQHITAIYTRLLVLPPKRKAPPPPHQKPTLKAWYEESL